MSITELATALCRFVGLYFMLNAFSHFGTSVIVFGLPLLFGTREQVLITDCAQHGTKWAIAGLGRTHCVA
jgi:hypothetical protein